MKNGKWTAQRGEDAADVFIQMMMMMMMSS